MVVTSLEYEALEAHALAGRVKEFEEARRQRCADDDLKRCPASIFGGLHYEFLGTGHLVGASGSGVGLQQSEDEEFRQLRRDSFPCQEVVQDVARGPNETKKTWPYWVEEEEA